MRVEQVADGIHRVAGTEVNWYLLTDGDAVTLIDAGYPGDASAVEASVAAIGRRPEDIAAVLITHAHVDHIGGVNHRSSGTERLRSVARSRRHTHAANSSSRPAPPTSSVMPSTTACCVGRWRSRAPVR